MQREESFAENVATLLDLEQLKRVFAKPTALTEQGSPTCPVLGFHAVFVRIAPYKPSVTFWVYTLSLPPSSVQPRRVFVVPSETKRTLFKGTRAQNIAIVLARLPLTLDVSDPSSMFPCSYVVASMRAMFYDILLQVIAEQLKALNAKKKLTSDVIEKINEVHSQSCTLFHDASYIHQPRFANTTLCISRCRLSLYPKSMKTIKNL